ncbi:MAG: CBS domain-containing protein [Chitinophagaceae bacterium]|nr:MAG: CBS domain-containing protein [Chitinophagaceae bacterium]
MNQENMSNEDRRIQKLMEQQANNESLEDKRVRRLMEQEATNTNQEDQRVERIMDEQAGNHTNEDRRIAKLIDQDADSPLTHKGYSDGTERYNVEEPAPLDNSLRVDQIDSQRGRAETGAIGAITPVRPVSAGVDPVNFADALEQWRYMSEKYRDAREKKQNNPVHQQKFSDSLDKSNYMYNTNQFQKQYERDTVQLTEPEPKEDIAVLMDQVQEKINYFQTPHNASATTNPTNNHPETEYHPEPVQQQKNIQDVQQLLSLIPDNTSQYNENHNYIQSRKSKDEFRDRIISRLSTANLEIAPDLIDESHYEEIEPHGEILTLSDVMTKNVISVIDSMTIEQVASIFNKKKIMGVPVIHYQTKQPVGMITMSDIIEHIFDEGMVSTFPIEGNTFQQDTFAVLDKPIRDLMHTDIIHQSSPSAYYH